jgi:hypothetical protein
LNSTVKPYWPFSARTLKKAHDLCTKDWLSTELDVFNSRGRPLWRDEADFKVRRANPMKLLNWKKRDHTKSQATNMTALFSRFLCRLMQARPD